MASSSIGLQQMMPPECGITIHLYIEAYDEEFLMY
jgi:hypothetical protein